MLRIRLLQLKIEDLYHLDEMKTPVHLYIGQEAIAAGVCAHLEKADSISSNHRSHGHYLAKGGDMQKLVAELYCRATGCSRGFGGSMHIVDTDVGHMGSSSIVGGGIPIGVGIGMSIKMRNEKRISAIFLGDGASDEGVLYESVNFAMLKKLPVVFLLENNQFSVCSRVSTRQDGKLMFHYLPESRLMTRLVDGNCVADVYNASKTAVERARSGEGPSFLEFNTYRMRGHAGAGSDAHLGYRTEEEIAEWEGRDPLNSFRKDLLESGVMSQDDIANVNSEIQEEVERAFEFAKGSPLPEVGQIYKYLFRE